MDNWDEIRTAFQVARAGTVSGAATAMGVHHATVIRHIDALETRLGVKLFQRHARGYTTTEAGLDLLQVAQATDDQFTQLAGRIKGQGAGVSGDLVVTSLGSLSRFVTPALVSFQDANPEIRVRYLTGDRLFRLEYGEAHVAIRAGKMPDQPDNVVQPFMEMGVKLVASDAYVAKHGLPKGEADFANHWFASHDSDASRAPFNQWLRTVVSGDRIVFRATGNRNVADAVVAGAGIGFLSEFEINCHDGLHEVIPSRDDWAAPLWLVTHVDLHRTPKVQAALAHLKSAAAARA
ncbi:MAG: DNA-binding transcriptional LysR family regulator [Yoonia sp.]|jgi:DNA-binding transcriptional LysR family regulator